MLTCNLWTSKGLVNGAHVGLASAALSVMWHFNMSSLHHCYLLWCPIPIPIYLFYSLFCTYLFTRYPIFSTHLYTVICIFKPLRHCSFTLSATTEVSTSFYLYHIIFCTYFTPVVYSYLLQVISDVVLSPWVKQLSIFVLSTVFLHSVVISLTASLKPSTSCCICKVWMLFWSRDPRLDRAWSNIVPSIAHWEKKSGKPLTCTQLPFNLAWGITIHKSQGLTLTKAVVELGHADFSLGLSFVAISQVKTLDGVVF
jgi:hypothetical protein